MATRLERMADPLTGEVALRRAPQLVVDQREQPIGRLPVAFGSGDEQVCRRIVAWFHGGEDSRDLNR